MGRLLGLDYGEKRIGLAVSDELGLTTRPLEALQVTSKKQVLQDLVDLIDEYKIERLVVGLPLSLDGTIGKQVQKVQEFMLELAGLAECPIETVDERYTSEQAKDILGIPGRKLARNKGLIDSQAAQLILSSYLNR